MASQAELRRYLELRRMEMVGEISDLSVQPGFRVKINGKPVCKYVADFRYVRDGLAVIEDVKGVQTDVFKIKRKLVEAIYGIRVEIVR